MEKFGTFGFGGWSRLSLIFILVFFQFMKRSEFLVLYTRSAVLPFAGNSLGINNEWKKIIFAFLSVTSSSF